MHFSAISSSVHAASSAALLPSLASSVARTLVVASAAATSARRSTPVPRGPKALSATNSAPSTDSRRSPS